MYLVCNINLIAALRLLRAMLTRFGAQNCAFSALAETSSVFLVT